jgi:hypothetical protein
MNARKAGLVAAFLMASFPALGHSFYPYECCSDVDCYPIAVEDVKATPKGWFITKERITIPYESARPSPDGRFHICRNELGKGTLITPSGQPPCFWAPEGAS